MRIVVDLNRCQSYGQCVFAAPEVFGFRGEESLEYDHAPGAASDAAVRRAALACPVQAITLDASTEQIPLPEAMNQGASSTVRFAPRHTDLMENAPERGGGARSGPGRRAQAAKRGVERRDANERAGR